MKEKCDILDKVVNDAHATVHIVIVWMSKVKYAGCFDGEVMDNCSLIHVVAFDDCQRDNIQKLEGRAAALKNCHTQFSTYTKKMEIFVKSYTVIEESDVNTIASTL